MRIIWLQSLNDMKGLLITLALVFVPLFTYGQLVNELNFNLGFTVNTYDIKNTQGFSNATHIEEISLFISTLGKKNFSKKLSFDYGFGINREYLGFNPFIKISDINSLETQNLDTLTIAEVGNWDWQFLLPLGISYKLFEQKDIFAPLIILPGMRLNAGIQNRITFNRINTDIVIIRNFDGEYGYYLVHDDESLNNHVSDYYSDKIKRYKLMMYFGLEFFYKYGAIGFLGGVKYNRYILSPIDFEIKNKGSMTGYIGLYYEFNSR